MIELFKLLKRLIIHKFWVAYYCFQLGLYWQGITHDLSKLSLTEISGALKYWNNSKSSLAYEKELNGYSATFLHHRGRNPHHYEYWIHSLDEGGIPAKMPRRYVLELICDYLAACRTYGGNPRNEIDWWLKVSPSIKMHEDTKFYIWRVFDYFHSNINSSLSEAVAYSDNAATLSIGDTVYSEFIKLLLTMQILNLTKVENSDIKYSISRFPDGEVQITLGEFSRKDEIEVHCRITNSEELFILMQVADILNRHEMTWDLVIYYLMGMRMDRVMDFNRPFTLKVIANIIDSLKARMVSFLELHSDKIYDLTKTYCNDFDLVRDEDYRNLHPYNYTVHHDFQVVYPDKGAKERYDRYGGHEAVYAEKVRNVETGKIESIRIVNPEQLSSNDKPLIIVDDLCDGGGTFVGLAQEIRKYCPDRELNIFVTHMVNYKGIENLSKNFDHVYFTNSYCDWESRYKVNGVKFPENITQINVI